jgi:hypothetical protein
MYRGGVRFHSAMMECSPGGRGNRMSPVGSTGDAATTLPSTRTSQPGKYAIESSAVAAVRFLAVPDQENGVRDCSRTVPSPATTRARWISNGGSVCIHRGINSPEEVVSNPEVAR